MSPSWLVYLIWKKSQTTTADYFRNKEPSSQDCLPWVWGDSFCVFLSEQLWVTSTRRLLIFKIIQSKCPSEPTGCGLGGSLPSPLMSLQPVTCFVNPTLFTLRQATLCFRSEHSVLKVAGLIHVSVFYNLRNSHIVNAVTLKLTCSRLCLCAALRCPVQQQRRGGLLKLWCPVLSSCVLPPSQCKVFFFFPFFFSHPFPGFCPAAVCSVYSWSHNLSFTGLFVVKLPWLLLSL